MLALIITEKSGNQRRLEFAGTEASIGRLDDNDIVLPRNNISKHHARLMLDAEGALVEDLGSTNGTFLNGRRIHGPVRLDTDDRVYIGDFILSLSAYRNREGWPAAAATDVNVEEGAHGPAGPLTSLTVPSAAAIARSSGGDPARGPSSRPPPLPGSQPVAAPQQAQPPDAQAASRQSTPPQATTQAAPTAEPVHAGTTVPAPPPTGDLLSAPRHELPPLDAVTLPSVLPPGLRLKGALATLMERLATHMATKGPREGAFPGQHEATLSRLIDDLAREGVVGPDLDRRFLHEAAVSEAVGLGPLDRLLRNRSVERIVIEGPDRVLADLGGGVSPVSAFFSSTDVLIAVARRLLRRAGVEFDEEHTVHEGRLPDGSQVTVLTPGLIAEGLVLTVQCARQQQADLAGLAAEGVLSRAMVEVLRSALRARANIMVTGLRACTLPLLSALLRSCPEHERVVALESSPQLSLTRQHVLSLNRTRAADGSLSTMLDYVDRLACDRLVLAELRPGEMLEALVRLSQERGALLSLPAASPDLALAQLQLVSGWAATPPTSLTELIAAAVQLFVHVEADEKGERRVTTLAELHLNNGRELTLVPLFRFEDDFLETGHTPRFPVG